MKISNISRVAYTEQDAIKNGIMEQCNGILGNMPITPKQLITAAFVLAISFYPLPLSFPPLHLSFFSRGNLKLISNRMSSQPKYQHVSLKNTEFFLTFFTLGMGHQNHSVPHPYLNSPYCLNYLCCNRLVKETFSRETCASHF